MNEIITYISVHMWQFSHLNGFIGTNKHCGNATLAAWCLKSSAARLFVPKLVRVNNNRKHQSSALLALYEGNHRHAMDSPHKRQWYGNTLHFVMLSLHDDVIKWKHFRVTGPLWGEFTGRRWIPLTKPGTRSFDVFFDLLLNKRLVNNRWVGDLRRHRAHYDVTVMVHSTCPNSQLICHIRSCDWKLIF